jgi:hypothetical protein
MTQTLGFGWTYSNATQYVITELFADGTSRTVQPEYALYQTWIGSNTPSQIAGNQYVTFPGGVPTYNATQAQADQIAAAATVAYQQIISPDMQFANLVITTYLAQVAAAESLTFSAATAKAWSDWRVSMIAAYNAGKSTGIYNWPVSPTKPF